MQCSRFISVIALASVVALTSGCATAGKAMQPPVPDAHSAKTVGGYTHQLSRALMTPQIEFWATLIPEPSSPDNQSTDDATTTFDMTWGDKAKALSLQHVRDDFQLMCSSRGGEWKNPYCQGNGDPDRVLFYAVIEPHVGPRPDQNEVGFKTFVIEPKTGHETSPGYLALLHRKTAFMTQADIAAAEARQREQRALALDDAARAAAELPQVRTIGSRICRVENDWVTTGYVESVTSEKIQIRIDNVGFIRDQNMHPGEFAGPHIIWDTPSRWRLCE